MVSYTFQKSNFKVRIYVNEKQTVKVIKFTVCQKLETIMGIIKF